MNQYIPGMAAAFGIPLGIGALTGHPGWGALLGLLGAGGYGYYQYNKMQHDLLNSTAQSNEETPASEAPATTAESPEDLDAPASPEPLGIVRNNKFRSEWEKAIPSKYLDLADQFDREDLEFDPTQALSVRTRGDGSTETLPNIPANVIRDGYPYWDPMRGTEASGPGQVRVNRMIPIAEEFGEEIKQNEEYYRARDNRPPTWYITDPYSPSYAKRMLEFLNYQPTPLPSGDVFYAPRLKKYLPTLKWLAENPYLPPVPASVPEADPASIDGPNTKSILTPDVVAQPGTLADNTAETSVQSTPAPALPSTQPAPPASTTPTAVPPIRSDGSFYSVAGPQYLDEDGKPVATYGLDPASIADPGFLRSLNNLDGKYGKTKFEEEPDTYDPYTLGVLPPRNMINSKDGPDVRNTSQKAFDNYNNEAMRRSRLFLKNSSDTK
jgi:hypothetical protein